MNLHPIFVHFPIALLTVYALLEFIRFKKILAQQYWFYIKAILAILGAGAAWVALITGDAAKSAILHGIINPAVTNVRRVINIHENFAHLSTAIFSIIALIYLLAWLQRFEFGQYIKNPAAAKIWELAVRVAPTVLDNGWIILLAVIGLACISITGALGGSMIYGTASDPFIKAVYNIIGI